MEVSEELLEAVSASRELVALEGISAIDLGVDPTVDEPDWEGEAVLRITVDDAANPPQEVLDLSQQVSPVQILEGTIELHQLPDLGFYDPVRGGVSCARTTGLSRAGTVGAIVRDTTQTTPEGDPIPLGLSNHHIHCFDPVTGHIGDEIAQPEPQPPAANARLGEVVRLSFPQQVPGSPFGGAIGFCDAAICSIERDWLAEIVDIGQVVSTGSAQFGDFVRKRGRSTGLTEGRVSGLHGVYWHPNQATLVDQIAVRVEPPFARWSEPGDSGSVVVRTEDLAAVGLHWGANTATGEGLANDIDTVCAELQVSFVW